MLGEIVTLLGVQTCGVQGCSVSHFILRLALTSRHFWGKVEKCLSY